MSEGATSVKTHTVLLSCQPARSLARDDNVQAWLYVLSWSCTQLTTTQTKEGFSDYQKAISVIQINPPLTNKEQDAEPRRRECRVPAASKLSACRWEEERHRHRHKLRPKGKVLQSKDAEQQGKIDTRIQVLGRLSHVAEDLLSHLLKSKLKG